MNNEEVFLYVQAAGAKNGIITYKNVKSAQIICNFLEKIVCLLLLLAEKWGKRRIERAKMVLYYIFLYVQRRILHIKMTDCPFLYVRGGRKETFFKKKTLAFARVF